MGLLVLLFIACGDASESFPATPTPVSNLTPSEIDQLHDTAATLAQDGILEPGVPLYLPANVSTVPSQTDGSPTHANLLFIGDAVSPAGEGEPTAESVDIGQDTGPPVVFSEQTVDLGGILAESQIVPEGDHVSYILQFRSGDRNMLVAIRWAATSELTREMRSQTELVANSVVADLQAQGLH